MDILRPENQHTSIQIDIKEKEAQTIIYQIESLLSQPKIKSPQLSTDQKELLTKILIKKKDIRHRLNEIALQKLTTPQQKLRQWRDLEVYLALLGSHCNSEERPCWDSIMEKVRTAIQLQPNPAMAIWKSPIEKLENLISEAIPASTSLPEAPSQLNIRNPIPISDKTFASIHAEALIKGSPLEGNQSIAVVTYLHDFLTFHADDYGDIANYEHLIKMTGDATTLGQAAKLDIPVTSFSSFERFKKEFNARHQPFHEQFCTIIQSLQPHEKTMTEIGWTAEKSGHSMKLTIEKEPSGTLQLTVYNLGHGIEYHDSLMEHGENLVLPFLTIAHVDQEKLLNPKFTKALLELMLIPKHPDDAVGATKYGASDIYDLILKGLGGERLPCSGEREKFLPPQQAGICTWASLVAVLHGNLTLKDYYRLSCDVALDSLCAFYQQHQKELETNEQHRHLLGHALVNTAQLACDAYLNQGISVEKLQKFYATFVDLQASLDNAAGQAGETTLFQKELTFDNLQPTKPHSYLINAWNLVEQQPRSNPFRIYENKPAELAEQTAKEYDFSLLKDPATATEGLKELEQYLRTNYQVDRMLARSTLERFFALQVESGMEQFWEQIPTKEISAAIVHLAAIGDLLFVNVNTSPRRKHIAIDQIYYLSAISLLLDQRLKGEGDPSYDLGAFSANAAFSTYNYLPTVTSSLEGTSENDLNLYSTKERILRNTTINLLQKFKELSKDEHRIRYLRFNKWDYKRTSNFHSTIKEPQAGGVYNEYDLRYIDQYLQGNRSLIDTSKSQHENVCLALNDWYGQTLPARFCALRRLAFISNAMSDGFYLNSQQKISSEIRDDKIVTTSNFIQFDPSLRDFKSEDSWKQLKNIRHTQSAHGKIERKNFMAKQSESEVMHNRAYGEWENHLRLILAEGDLNDQAIPFEQQVIKAMAYYSEHQELFYDHDKRMLLRFLLFEENRLEKLLAQNPSFASLLQQFVESNYRQACERQEIAVAAFFMEIARDLSEIVTHCGCNATFLDTRPECSNLLTLPGLSPEERTLLHMQITASYVNDPPETFTSHHAAQLLTALLHEQVFPLVQYKATDHLLDLIEEAGLHWQPELHRLLQSEEGSSICCAVYKVFVPNAVDQEWNCTTNYPLCRSADEQFALDAEGEALFLQNHSLTGLPKGFLEDKNFKKLFGGNNFQTYKINDNCYQFVDGRGIETQLFTDNNGIQIRQKLADGKWYQLTTRWEGWALATDFGKLPEDFLKICNEHSLWIEVGEVESKSILVRELPTLETRYCITTQQMPPKRNLYGKIEQKLAIVNCCKNPHSSEPLFLVDFNNVPSTEALALFEDAMLWRDQNGQLKELEIASLKLSFTMREKEGTWFAESLDYPGYRIATNQRYRGLDFIKGSIVLENEKGARKLILPCGEVEPREKGSFTSKLRIVKDKTDPAMAFDLDPHGRPLPRQRAQKIYLAKLLIQQKKYQQAQRLLRSSHSHVIAFNQAEQNHLLNTALLIFDGKDSSPHATALLLTVFSLLTPKALNEHEKEMMKELLKDSIQRYPQFKAQTALIPDLKPTPNEEIKALSYLLDLCQKVGRDGLSLLSTFFQACSSEEQLLLAQSHDTPAKKVNFSFKTAQGKRGNSWEKWKLADALITRPQYVDLIEWRHLLQEDPLELELLLLGAEKSGTIPNEMIILLRSILNGSSLSFKDVRRVLDNEDEETFKLMVAQAEEFERNRIQDLAKSSNTTTMLTGQRPAKASREQKQQQITVRSQSASALELTPLPPRQPFLNTEQFVTIFEEIDNPNLQLSPDEIKELQLAVLHGGHDVQPEEALALASNIENYWSHPRHSEKGHRLDPAAIDKTATLLAVANAEMGKNIQIKQHELLDFANRLPPDLQSAVLFTTEKMGHLRQEITVNDLILWASRPDYFSFEGKNELLALESKALMGRTLQLLDLKVHQQQLKRAITLLKELDKIDSGSNAYERLSQSLYHELTRKLPYNPTELPELLVFELLEGIGLHQWQVDDLQRMLRPEPGQNSNIILEKVMGSGKTKVYLPLLALNKADGDHLAIIVVHPSQYESVADAMQTSSGQLFGQAAHAFNFSRHSDTSLTALKKLLAECEAVRAQRHFFIATDKAIHSLGLAFDELWDSYLASPDESDNLSERIVVMRQILNLFQSKGSAVFDEADLLLNCRYEVVYALGKPQSISPEHANIVADLYRVIEPLLSSLSPFTLEKYQELKPQLIATFVTELSAEGVIKGDHDLLFDYLSGGKDGADYVAELPEELRNILAVALYEFKELLPVVLDKRCGEHYGYSDNPEKILPVPYVASGVPSATSEFSFPYALLSYTIQTLQEQEVSQEYLKQIVQKLQSRAERERKANPMLELQKTQAYAEFRSLCGGLAVPFLKINDKDIAQVAALYKEDRSLIYPFAKKYLFPAVKLHSRKLTSTPYTLCNMFSQVQGFTGTPWNSKTYPDQLETLRDPLSAGKTQGIIWKNSQHVHTLSGTNFNTQIKEIAKLNATGRYAAFIDVGALFNGIDDLTVVTELLKSLPKKKFRGVLFHQNGKPYVLERGKGNEPVPYEKYGSTESLYIFYQQWYTTGTDYKIPGKALLSIGKNNKMRDLEQGYMRDRQAEIGERVEFVVPPESRAYCHSVLSLENESEPDCKDLLRFTELNQENELNEQLLMGTFGRLQEVIHNYVKQLQCNAHIPPSDIKKHAAIVKELIGESAKDSPWEQLGRYQKPIDSKDFFTSVIDKKVKTVMPLLQIFSANNSLAEEQLRAALWQCINLDLLPKQLSTLSGTSPNQLVEQQSQAEVQQERMALVQKEAIGDMAPKSKEGIIHWNWKSDIPSYSRSFYRLINPQALANETEKLPIMFFDTENDILFPKAESQAPFLSVAEALADSKFADYADLFDIEASYNFLPGWANTIAGLHIYNRVRLIPFEEGQLEVQNLLICHDRESQEVQVKLLSQADTGFFFAQLGNECLDGNKVAREVDVTLYNLTLGPIQSNNQAIQNGSIDPVSDEVRRKIIQAKFFNGDSIYTEKELPLLEEWLQAKGIDRMKELFTKIILPNKEEKLKQFHGSVLASLLLLP